MSLFLIDGRDSDGETVKVADAELVEVSSSGGVFEGVTTLLTEHGLTVFLDERTDLPIGTPIAVKISRGDSSVEMKGVVTGIRESGSGAVRTHTIEILDFMGNEAEYWQVLYDRVPTLPQSLHRDFGVFTHLWQNVAHRASSRARL